MAFAALISYVIILKKKEFKTPKEQLEFLMEIKNAIIQLITLEHFLKYPDESLEILRIYFQFYASNEELLIEGLKFFSLFADLIKIQKFNSIKAFLFYFAYQTKKYNFPQVQELLRQELLNVNIIYPKVYLEFCMYCFYKGLYYIERKNYYMASYLYCVAVYMGLRGNSQDSKIFNSFSIQMIRSLCFLKSLTDFDIRNYLYKESRRGMHYESEIFLIKQENINEYLNYLLKEKNELENFKTFVKSNKDFDSKYRLKGLRNEAEEALIFKKIKDTLCLYKKIKMGKLSQNTKIEYNDLIKVMKKKVLAGEINLKFDEKTDEIEVLDIDPGLKERVEKTKELYKNIIEGNKNLFIILRDKKIDEISGKKDSREEMDLSDFRNMEENYEEDYVEMDLDEN